MASPEKDTAAVIMPGDHTRQQMEKSDSKLVRFFTVIAYVCSVSLAALFLSLYYIFLWEPADHPLNATVALDSKFDNDILDPQPKDCFTNRVPDEMTIP